MRNDDRAGHDTAELFEIDTIGVLATSPNATLFATREHSELWVPSSVIVERCADSVLVTMWWARKRRLDREKAA